MTARTTETLATTMNPSTISGHNQASVAGTPCSTASECRASYDIVKPATASFVDYPSEAIAAPVWPTRRAHSSACARRVTVGRNGGKDGADLQGALEVFNNAPSYVRDVLGWANTYGGLSVGTTVGVDAVATSIAFAESQLGKLYQLGATGPDAWDCSALVQAAYAAAGITLPRTTYEWRRLGPSSG